MIYFEMKIVTVGLAVVINEHKPGFVSLCSKCFELVFDFNCQE
jgi:hypothetical protein